MQRMGKYPPPPGASDIPGLEVSGEIVAVREVSTLRVGDEVCALVAGGGYAEYCAAPAEQCLPVPAAVPVRARGRDPRDLLHRVDEPVRSRRLRRGETRAGPRRHQRHRHDGDPAGARVRRDRPSPPPDRTRSATPAARSAPSRAINYRAEDFVEVVKEATGGEGVNVILDIIGGDYVARNLECLRPERPPGADRADGGIEDDRRLPHRAAEAAHAHRLDATLAHASPRRAPSRASSSARCGRCSIAARCVPSFTTSSRSITPPTRTASWKRGASSASWSWCLNSCTAINAVEMSFPSRGASSTAKGSGASRPHSGDMPDRRQPTRRSSRRPSPPLSPESTLSVTRDFTAPSPMPNRYSSRVGASTLSTSPVT